MPNFSTDQTKRAGALAAADTALPAKSFARRLRVLRELSRVVFLRLSII
jgi:hypothetical protein